MEDENESDAILRTGDDDVNEELDNFEGYREHIRDMRRMMEE
jgi:hypothetical protein